MNDQNKPNDGDYIDEVIQEWAEQIPDLETKGLAIGGRIVVLARLIEGQVDKHLASHKLQIWGFDVLASLYRSGPPYTQVPTRLMRNCFLSSGSITNRVTRLSDRGLVVRTPAQDDKRSIKVTLTPKGIELVEKAMLDRVDKMKPTFDLLSARDQETLTKLLRKFLVRLQDMEDWE